MRATKQKNATSAKQNSSLFKAYDYIKNGILCLDFPPGMSLTENYFVDLLKISRTPVREALIKLASEGLVVNERNHGAWVSEITLLDIREFFEALEVSQRMVTKFAAMRFRSGDLEALREHERAFERKAVEGDVVAMHDTNYLFHSTIAANCGNSFIEEHYLKLLNTGMRVSYLALTYEKQIEPDAQESGLNDIGQEHHFMFKYILEGQADKAEEVAHQHTINFRERVMNYLTTSAARTIEL